MSLAAALSTPVCAQVCEGANTMDIGRTILQNFFPRRRLDAGTYGTMGVGLGFAIAAAAVHPELKVVTVQGDSAFGFSGMEIEVACRFKMPITVIIVNNNGIYQVCVCCDCVCVFLCGCVRRGPTVSYPRAGAARRLQSASWALWVPVVVAVPSLSVVVTCGCRCGMRFGPSRVCRSCQRTWRMRL